MSGPTSRVISQCPIYKNIQDAQKRYGDRLTFNLSGEEIIKILVNQPKSAELQKLIDKMLRIAEDKVDKRGIDKQREIREKYQPTHGLIFKNIPMFVSRQVVYDAILKLGESKNNNENVFVFEGELKMRSFQFPKDNKKMRSTRNAFPIFVLQADRDKVLEIAEKNNGELTLPVEDNREYNFYKKEWDGIVYVERVKNQHSRSSSMVYSEHESDYQAINRSRTPSFDNNDAFSNASFGSSNRLFQTPNPCTTPNPPMIYTPNPTPMNMPQLNNMNPPQVPVLGFGSQPPMFPMVPTVIPNFQNFAPPNQNFMQNNNGTPNPQINSRLLQNAPAQNTICSGAQFVKDHGDNIIQKQQNAQKFEKQQQQQPQSDVEAELD